MKTWLRPLAAGALRRAMLGAAIVLALLAPCAARADAITRGIFTVEFQPSDRAIAEGSLAVLEEAQREFAQRLPAGNAPVRVTIAGTLGEFVRRAGNFRQLRVSGIARPAKGEIVVQSPRIRLVGEDYNGTLRHELLHVLLHRNTNTANLPRWLNEGLCMSYANEYYWQSGIQVARLFVTGRVLPLGRLDRAFTVPGDEQEFGDAYAQGLSLVHYMRDTLGEETFWNVVLRMRDEDFDSALRHAAGMTTEDLWTGYYGSLWVVALIGGMTSGSLLGPAAFLAIIAWWRIRRRNHARLLAMAEEERNAPPEEYEILEEDEEEAPTAAPPAASTPSPRPLP